MKKLVFGVTTRRNASWLMAWVLFGAAAAIHSGAAVAADHTPVWPQWRGPNRDGHLRDAAPWPDRLQGDALVESWRMPLAPSYSGPIVAVDRVFVTETKDKTDEIARALDRKTGRPLWEAKWPGSMRVPFFAAKNGDWIRATPAYDGETLFVAGMRDVLVALDAESGAERWRVDFVERYQSALPSFGFVCSPLVVGDAIYVQAGAAFVKLDKRTGQSLWRVLDDGGGMYGSAFSSPVIGQINDRSQLLVQTRKRLAGVDPDTGQELWSQDIPAFQGMNILTPVLVNNAVFTSTYGGGTTLLKISGSDGIAKTESAWTEKTQGYMSTPVVIDGHVYLHLRNQRFCCIELATGQIRWTTQPYGQYWSLVANGDKILALDERGELLLIRANPQEFELLDSRKISESPTWAHLAVCGDELFVRELESLVAYRWR